jgi:hypothetical protein
MRKTGSKSKAGADVGRGRWRWRMKDYRLVFIGNAGEPGSPVAVQCRDDVEATVFAEARRSEHVLELWAANRMVARFPMRTSN